MNQVYNQYRDKNNKIPMTIKNALYFGFERYLGRREYAQNDELYLNGLLTDVEQGKRHHNEVCFYDSDAENVFRSIKHTLVALMVNSSGKSN